MEHLNTGRRQDFGCQCSDTLGDGFIFYIPESVFISLQVSRTPIFFLSHTVYSSASQYADTSLKYNFVVPSQTYKVRISR